MDANIIVVSHNDLDGVFCGALANLAYPSPKFNTSIYYCGYGDVNDRVKGIIENTLPNLTGVTIVYITDISVNEEVAELINKTHNKVIGDSIVQFCLLDHHGNEQVLALNKYDWANVSVYMGDLVVDKDDPKASFFSAGSITNKKTCGTRMFFDALASDLNMEFTDVQMHNLERYVELVRKYDTWEWATSGDDTPNKFNTLFKIYTRKMFVEAFSQVNRYDSSEYFDLFERTVITLDEEKKKSYIKGKLREASYMTVGGKCAAVVMAEQYISELGNEMCLQLDKADFAIVVGSKSVSFRSSNGTNVAEIAQLFGGNGHPASSGAQIPDEIRFDLLSDLVYMLQKDIEDEA